MADVMEQALLLLRDFADLRSMRKHKVFLTLKRDPALVSLLTTFFAFGIIIDRLIVIHYYYYYFWKDVQAAYKGEELVTSPHK